MGLQRAVRKTIAPSTLPKKSNTANKQPPKT
jgi:hypothetical protein